MMNLIIIRVRRGIGVFDFNNNKQTFALEQCSHACLIKCYISVCHQEKCNKELWYQRKELLLFLEQLMVDIHHICIPKDKQPVAHLNCCFAHQDDCEPHLRYKAIATADVVCTKVNILVKPEVFNLLIESPDVDGKHLQKVCVCLHVLFCACMCDSKGIVYVRLIITVPMMVHFCSPMYLINHKLPC